MHTKILILFTFLLFCGQSLMSQETVDKDSLDLPVVVEYGSLAPTYEIAEITVSGAPNYDDFVLIGYSGLAVGEEVSVPGEKITAAVKRFWKQGLFSDVKISATKIQDGKVWLHIALQQRPRVSEINYHGLKKSEIEDVEKKVGQIKGTQITPNIADRVKLIIARILEEKGFANADIKLYQKNDPNSEGNVIVDIEVDKKAKTKIHAIYVRGNNSLPYSKINKVMKKTNSPSLRNFFRTKKFVREEYEKDKVSLVEKYNEIGYRDAYIVSDSVVPSVEENKVDVYITLDEGDKYYFGDIKWIGNTKYPYEILNDILGIKKGDVYNYTQLTKRLYGDDDAVSKLYQDRGYLFSHIDPVEVNFVGDTIDFEMRIMEGKPAIINEVNIIGNERVYEHVVRRELRTRPGQLYSQSEVIRTLRELSQMGHFDSEQLMKDFQAGGISPNPEDGTVDLNYNLKTKGSDQVEFGLGWGATGLVGNIGLKFSNFAIQNIFRPETYKIVPQGEGQTFTINARSSGKMYSTVSLSFLEPWLGGKRPNSLSASIYYAAQSDVRDGYRAQYNRMMQQNPYGYGGYGGYGGAYGNQYGGGYGQDQSFQMEIDPDKYMRTLGASLGYGKRLSWPDDFFQFYGEMSYQLYMLKNWYQVLYPLGNGNYNSLSLNLTFSRNSIDHPIYSRSGSSFTLGLQVTPPYSLMRAKEDYSPNLQERYEKHNWLEFHKWKFNAKMFTPISYDQKLVLMGRADFGYLGHFDKNLRSPIGTFTMGGDGMSAYTSYGEEYISMRGYESASLSPYDPQWGTNKGFLYNKFTLELRYPLSLEQSATIWVLAFAEAGNSFNSFKNYNPFNLKRSAGIGARIFLPMFGIIGIDWAYGFDPSNLDSKIGGSQFHFVLGQEL